MRGKVFFFYLALYLFFCMFALSLCLVANIYYGNNCVNVPHVLVPAVEIWKVLLKFKSSQIDRLFKGLIKDRKHEYRIYPAIRRVFCSSGMTSNN